jgi:hypothetical protein
MDEDADRYLLAFFLNGRHLRLLIENSGNVVQRSSVDIESGVSRSGAQTRGVTDLNKQPAMIIESSDQVPRATSLK